MAPARSNSPFIPGRNGIICPPYPHPAGLSRAVKARQRRRAQLSGPCAWLFADTGEAAGQSVAQARATATRFQRGSGFARKYTDADRRLLAELDELHETLSGKATKKLCERAWRSVKYEEMYLRAYEDILTARASLGRYSEFCNTKKRHQSFD